MFQNKPRRTLQSEVPCTLPLDGGQKPNIVTYCCVLVNCLFEFNVHLNQVKGLFVKLTQALIPKFYERQQARIPKLMQDKAKTDAIATLKNNKNKNKDR